MNILAKILLCFVLVLSAGCSKGGDESAEKTPPSLNPRAQDLTPPEPAESQKPGVVPVTLSPEDREKAAKAPPGMAFIKGGCFMMGTRDAQTDEQPQHEVCLDDFYMDKYEVTQARWKKVVGSNPSKFIGDDLPVEQVNYYDIQEFIKKSNGECRLPTEAEWEYAAGGGAKTRYYWGNMMEDAYAWYEDNSGKATHPAGKKLPNQFGLYDMMGNVWEWTDDWYETSYSTSEKNNPKGPAAGENKSIRGGAFDSSAGALRITNRTWLNPRNRVYSKVSTYGGIVNEIFNYIGFRCVKPLNAAPPAPAPASAPKKS